MCPSQAKFVLTLRLRQKWWISVHNMLARPKNNFRINQYVQLLNASTYSKLTFMRAYEYHNKAVVDFFRNELRQEHRLLVIDLANSTRIGASGQMRLCQFMGLRHADCPLLDRFDLSLSPFKNGYIAPFTPTKKLS